MGKGKVGIVGSGLVGKSWAMIFASAGYNVTIYDIKEDAVKNALGRKTIYVLFIIFSRYRGSASRSRKVKTPPRKINPPGAKIAHHRNRLARRMHQRRIFHPKRDSRKPGFEEKSFQDNRRNGEN